MTLPPPLGLVQRRDLLTAGAATLFVLVCVPFRWDAMEALGLLDPHPPLFGLPLPFIWWGGSSSMEFTLSPLGFAIDLLVGTITLAALFGVLRHLLQPRWRLSPLSLSCIAAAAVVPLFQLLLLVTRLSWTPFPVQATPSSFQLGLSSFYLPPAPRS